MYVQVIESGSKKLAQWFFLALGIAVVSVGASNALVSIGYINANIGAFIILGALAGFLISKIVTGYRYTLNGTMLYFERTMGARVYLLAGVDVSACTFLGLYRQDSGERAKTTRITNRPCKEGTYALEFTVDQKKGLQRILFHPDDALIAMLNEMRAQS